MCEKLECCIQNAPAIPAQIWFPITPLRDVQNIAQEMVIIDIKNYQWFVSVDIKL